VNVFTYRSLMFDQVWSKVVTGEYNSGISTVSGYIRYSLKGEEYPAVVPCECCTGLKGVVYMDIDSDDLTRLDAFEGEYYYRESAVVMVDGVEVEAEIYVMKGEYFKLLCRDAWNPESFRQSGIFRFIDNYENFS